MIGLAIALATLAAPFHLSAHMSNGTTTKRSVSATVRTIAGARCSLTDSVTDLTFHGTTSRAGRATWHWRPSEWANGVDGVSVRCAKGSFHRSSTAHLLILPLSQINKLRDYAIHLVYWAPNADMPTDVPPAMLRFETDVKASLDAGATGNPFAIPRGYADDIGADDPRIASVDAALDTDPYPTKPAPGYCRGASTPCLGDPDLANEVVRLGAQHGWLPGSHTLITVFTAPSVIVCSRFSTTNCTAQNEPCGYHDLTRAGYAYADIVMSGISALCGGPVPASQYAIAVTAHEQIEAIVDPLTNGTEVADPCEGQFASISINGDSYDLPAIEQPDGKCVFGYTP